MSELVGVKKISDGIPKDYRLNQNFPNPFNLSTIIKYELPINSHVTLVLYDILGREIAVIVNEKQSLGIYETQFDAVNYPSGVYFYKLTAEGSIIDTKKMILLK